VKRTKLAKQGAGRAIAAEETALPGAVDLRDVAGANAPQLTNALNADRPVRLRNALTDDEAAFIGEHTAARGGNPMVTVREAGELGRAQRQAAKDVFNARQSGTFLTPDDVPLAQAKAARGDRLFDLQDSAITAAGGNTSRLRSLRNEFKDLSTILAANNTLRSGIGSYAFRGGIGAGLGGNVAFLAGGDPVVGGMVGGLAGLGASPQNLSRAGFIGGNLAEAAPSLWRAGKAAGEAEDLFGEPDIRLRAPRR
jgi:hypothetical protein